MQKRCSKGKSCGATCITQSDRCVLELGPILSKSLTQARKKIGVMALWSKVQKHGAVGRGAKFGQIRKDLKQELKLGRQQIKKTEHLADFEKRLKEAGLIPKSKKTEPENLGDIFAKNIKKPEEKKAPSLPSDLRRQLFALPGQQSAPKEPAKKGSTDRIMDDISRIMRGSAPQNIKPAATREGRTERLKAFRAQAPAASNPSADTKWARGNAEDFDNSFKIYKRIRGDKDMIDWNETVKGGKQIGEGSFGTVMKIGNVAHKRGEISADEANIIKRVGEAGIGPKLHGAEISTKQREGYGVDLHNGRIAMSVVPGKEMGDVKPDSKVNGKNAADIYWKSMADLHRLGIAHNDAHPHNILVDDKGKGRWVDMGLAQQSPKAALAEAMGIFNTLPGASASRAPGAAGQGNWQTRGWDATGHGAAERARKAGGETWKTFMERFPVASTVWENRGEAQYKLMKMGLSKNDISSIIDHGIRSPMQTYDKGVWAKLTDKQAQEVLNTLYDGI